MKNIVKDLIGFGKIRAFITIFGLSIHFLFIDIFNWHYWQLAIWFLPLNFTVSFFLNRRVFKNGK